MHFNPYNEPALEIQICTLVLAPSFLAAGIYLMLKHIMINSGKEHSKVKPERYPWMWVGRDLFSITIQARGEVALLLRAPPLLGILPTQETI